MPTTNTQTYLECKVFQSVCDARAGFVPATSLDQESKCGRWLAMVDCSDFDTGDLCIDHGGK